MSKEHYRWLRVWTETGHLKFQSKEENAGVPELWGTGGEVYRKVRGQIAEGFGGYKTIEVLGLGRQESRHNQHGYFPFPQMKFLKSRKRLFWGRLLQFRRVP